MRKPCVLFIVGTSNQTTMMFQIYQHLKDECHCYFSNYYADGFVQWLNKKGFLEMTILGQKTRADNEIFFTTHGLQSDYRAAARQYDLIYLCQDAHVPDNIPSDRTILVQEGTIMPKDWRYYVVKALGLPRGLSDTAMFGLSDNYKYLCVAGEGYRKEFENLGVQPEKIKVTGIPNFDDVLRFRHNDFQYKNYVLVATSDLRESKRHEDRLSFIKKCIRIAAGRQLIFKLHPRENHERAIREIRSLIPDAEIFTSGKIEEMIANCDVLITKYSSVVLLAAALGKEIYSDFYAPEKLKELRPLQNDGTSAFNIAALGKKILGYSIKNKVHEFAT